MGNLATPVNRVTQLFEGVCVNYRHLGPRRVWMGGSKRRLWLISVGSAGSGSSGSVFQGPQYLTTLPSNMLKNGAGWAPKSLPGASGGLWGRSGHRLLFLRRKKAPAGALKTRIGFFSGKKRPARVLTGHIHRFFEGQLFFRKKTPREGAYRTHI